ncbi:hypothetical protein D8S78_00905 [Natrialba swarupiae]|nr:hypothetical protein [Natrialba swarupiae]
MGVGRRLHRLRRDPTAAGRRSEAIETCESTPIVLFSEASYAPTAARATDGLAGYVRRDADDAIVHLADEIEWVCRPSRIRRRTRDDRHARRPVGDERRPRRPTPRVARRRRNPEDRDRLFELLVVHAATALEVDYCWLSTVQFGEFTLRSATAAVPESDLDGMARDGVLDEVLRSGDP